MLSKVVEAAKQQTVGIHSRAEGLKVEFFPEDDALLRWSSLSVSSRVQKSDFHHYRLKGQWKVRDSLEKVASGAGVPLKAIWEAETPAAIEAIISKYQGGDGEEKRDEQATAS